MPIVRALKGWLERPPATGVAALFCAIAAIVLPTIIRSLVDEDVSGVAFSPYIPFVLLTAILTGWRYAALVTVASAIVADLLFIDPRFQPLAGPTDAFGISVFFASGALIIVLVQAARLIV